MGEHISLSQLLYTRHKRTIQCHANTIKERFVQQSLYYTRNVYIRIIIYHSRRAFLTHHTFRSQNKMLCVALRAKNETLARLTQKCLPNQRVIRNTSFSFRFSFTLKHGEREKKSEQKNMPMLIWLPTHLTLLLVRLKLHSHQTVEHTKLQMDWNIPTFEMLYGYWWTFPLHWRLRLVNLLVRLVRIKILSWQLPLLTYYKFE